MTHLRDLYAAIEPYVSGRLGVDEIHSLYWEECGNPNGIPVVFLHGGPGGGCSATSRRFFDPARYRVILFDQRARADRLPTVSCATTRRRTSSPTWKNCASFGD